MEQATASNLKYENKDELLRALMQLEESLLKLKTKHILYVENQRKKLH